MKPETNTAAESERLLTATLIAGLIATAMALLILSWLGREIVAGVTPELDDAFRRTIHAHASATITPIMIAASRYGGPSWLVPLGLCLALAFLIHGWHRGSLLVVITLAGAGLLNALLKQGFARTRPAPFFDYPLPDSASFPSGHAFFAASLLGGLAVLVTPRIRSLALKIGLWVLVLALILLIGFSRVYLGVHYPSDVLAGYAVAVVWVTAIALGDRIAGRRKRQGTPA
ncbi:MAG: phosphatase PAP2 family protein [Gemmatimonadales bacterium]